MIESFFSHPHYISLFHTTKLIPEESVEDFPRLRGPAVRIKVVGNSDDKGVKLIGKLNELNFHFSTYARDACFRFESGACRIVKDWAEITTALSTGPQISPVMLPNQPLGGEENFSVAEWDANRPKTVFVCNKGSQETRLKKISKRSFESERDITAVLIIEVIRRIHLFFEELTQNVSEKSTQKNLEKLKLLLSNKKLLNLTISQKIDDISRLLENMNTTFEFEQKTYYLLGEIGLESNYIETIWVHRKSFLNLLDEKNLSERCRTRMNLIAKISASKSHVYLEAVQLALLAHKSFTLFILGWSDGNSMIEILPKEVIQEIIQQSVNVS